MTDNVIKLYKKTSKQESHCFPRHTKVVPQVAVEGSGCYLIDADGKQYFDGSSGAAVSCLGHGEADVAAAMKDQIDKLSFAHTGFFTSEPAEALADLLIANAPLGIDRVYFVSGGSEAVEAALKLARQYFVEIGESNRTLVFYISRSGANSSILIEIEIKTRLCRFKRSTCKTGGIIAETPTRVHIPADYIFTIIFPDDLISTRYRFCRDNTPRPTLF